MSTAVAFAAVAFVSVAVSEMLTALWRGLRRALTRPAARAERAHRRYVAAQRNHCGGNCTTADHARRTR